MSFYVKIEIRATELWHLHTGSIYFIKVLMAYYIKRSDMLH